MTKTLTRKRSNRMESHFMKLGIVAGMLTALALPARAAANTFQIDPKHSDAQFAITHLMVSTVRGEFHGVNGTVVYDDQNVGNSSVNVTIDANTVDTREPDRDKDLRSEKFFDVAKFPTMTFKSTK